MPLIECLIEREGPTTINDGGFTFTFKENDAGHKVANVLSDGTADRLLSFKWFRLYNPDVDYPEPAESDDTGETAHEEGQGDTEPSTAEGGAESSGTELEPGDDEETETQTILRLRGAGKSYREIAEVVGKSKTYVSSVVNANK